MRRTRSLCTFEYTSEIDPIVIAIWIAIWIARKGFEDGEKERRAQETVEEREARLSSASSQRRCTCSHLANALRVRKRAINKTEAKKSFFLGINGLGRYNRQTTDTATYGPSHD